MSIYHDSVESSCMRFFEKISERIMKECPSVTRYKATKADLKRIELDQKELCVETKQRKLPRPSAIVDVPTLPNAKSNKEKMVHLYQNGVDIRKIADMFAVKNGVVLAALRDLKVPYTYNNHIHNEATIKRVKEGYERGEEAFDIAKELGITEKQVRTLAYNRGFANNGLKKKQAEQKLQIATEAAELRLKGFTWVEISKSDAKFPNNKYLRDLTIRRFPHVKDVKIKR